MWKDAYEDKLDTDDFDKEYPKLIISVYVGFFLLFVMQFVLLAMGYDLLFRTVFTLIVATVVMAAGILGGVIYLFYKDRKSR